MEEFKTSGDVEIQNNINKNEFSLQHLRDSIKVMNESPMPKRESISDVEKNYFLKRLTNIQKDLDPEFNDIVNNNWDELISK